MPRVEGLVPSAHLRMLVHGDTGSGKTHLVGTAALVKEMCPVVFFDFERGRTSVLNIPNLPLSQITFYDVTTASDLKDLEGFVMSGSGKGKPGPNFNTVIVDSLTEMYGLMMSLHLEGQGRSEAPPQLQDYGFVSNRMMKFLRSMSRYLQCNFIATAGTEMQKDELSGEIHQQPDILGKLNYRAGRFFDIVGFLRTDVQRRGQTLKVVRTLQLMPFKRVRAKCRFGGLGPVLASPTMTTIYASACGASAHSVQSATRNAQHTSTSEERKVKHA